MPNTTCLYHEIEPSQVPGHDQSTWLLSLPRVKARNTTLSPTIISWVMAFTYLLSNDSKGDTPCKISLTISIIPLCKVNYCLIRNPHLHKYVLMLVWKYFLSNKEVMKGITLFYVLLGDKVSFRKLSHFLKWQKDKDRSFRDSQWLLAFKANFREKKEKSNCTMINNKPIPLQINQ